MVAVWLCLGAGVAVGQQGVQAPGAAPPPPPPPPWAPVASARPPDQPDRYQLIPTAEGGYLHDGPRLRSRIGRDGSVTFSREPQFVLPDGPQHQRTVGRDAINSSSAENPAHEPIYVESRPGVRADLTEMYLRSLRQDPDRSDKAAFLTATFELRARLMAAEKSRWVQESLAELPARLEALWAEQTLSLQEKKRVLQVWWGELVDTDEGRQAAEIIAAFARQHLPRAEAEALRPAPPTTD